MHSSGARIKWVRVTDSEMLKQVGCPWSTNTLRQHHYTGKNKSLFTKVGGILMIDVDELEKILKKGKK